MVFVCVENYSIYYAELYGGAVICMAVNLWMGIWMRRQGMEDYAG